MDDSKMSFIDRVKTVGAQALLGVFVNTGKRFDRVLEGMRVTSITAGGAECEMPVGEGLLNTYSTLHGGATMTIVDVAGTMALLTLDPTRPGVSVDVNVSFLNPVKAGDTIRIKAKVLKTGKRLGCAQVDIHRASDNALVATGRHTKAL